MGAAADYYRKSGQIPAFGDWENANELPITQYFECARQAGLLRCSCSGECCRGGGGGSYMNGASSWGGVGGGADLYGVGFEKQLPRRVYAVPQMKTRGIPHSREQRKQVKVRDVMVDQPSAQKHRHSRQGTKSGNLVLQPKPPIIVKPVDEDLYKVPSELLENSKRKKVLGFFSRCMVPPCAA